MTMAVLGGRVLHAASHEISLHWLEPGEDVRDVVAQRLAIYGGELGWLGDGHVDQVEANRDLGSLGGSRSRSQDCWAPDDQVEASHVAWDDYDRYSSILVAFRAAELVASSRLTLESEGALEVSDLVDWKSALPYRLRGAVAAEWSRVMIAKQHRSHGLFRAMYASMLRTARARGARVIAGASVAELRPRYERLGFQYLDRPFRSPFFASSPTYYPAYQVLR